MATQDKKTWMMLENNPEVMTQLATTLGLSSELQFYDVYSLDEPALLSHIPRPALALLVIIPLTQAWAHDRRTEDAEISDYTKSGAGEPVVWFKQTIGNACGSIGVLHCAINGPAKEYIMPGSHLARIRESAIPLGMTKRAQMLYDNMDFERAHRSLEEAGDTAATHRERHAGQHFVAFVKAEGKLWELEGDRKGPLERGELAENEDVLSPRALDMGLKRIMGLKSEDEEQDVRFSCTVLARKL